MLTHVNLIEKVLHYNTGDKCNRNATSYRHWLVQSDNAFLVFRPLISAWLVLKHGLVSEQGIVLKEELILKQELVLEEELILEQGLVLKKGLVLEQGMDLKLGIILKQGLDLS